MLASFTSMDAESDHPRFGNPDSVKRRHALGGVDIHRVQMTTAASWTMDR